MSVFASLRTLKLARCYRNLHVYVPRTAPNSPYARPGPPPLPAAEQREFEELVRKAQKPAAPSDSNVAVKSGEELHPDARRPIPPEFTGDVNPSTGERGGPKREPVPEGRNDWSYGGRVTDF
ncbi:putative mitochondrial protein, conserved [Ceratobasidium sp. 370]|nr:putative mitochondrial protein, conserved [Ceratobasidium sp. 370]